MSCSTVTSLEPVRMDLFIGITWLADVIWKNDNGSMPDLSDGWEAKLQFRKQLEDEEPEVDLSHTDGITLGAQGAIAIEIPADVTATLDTVTLYGDLILKNTSSGAVQILCRIHLYCQKSFTR